jgi:hypothetical protein
MLNAKGFWEKTHQWHNGIEEERRLGKISSQK